MALLAVALVQLVWLGGWKMQWVLISRLAALNAIPALTFLMLMSVFMWAPQPNLTPDPIPVSACFLLSG